MKNKATNFAFSFIFCLMFSLGFAQNPILRSNTTGTPSPAIPGASTSIITQYSNMIGIGITSPTKLLTLHGTEQILYDINGNPSSAGQPIIRLSMTGLIANSLWDIEGGGTFILRNAISNIIPISVKSSGEIDFLDKINLSAQTITSSNDNRLGFLTDNSRRRLFWTSYTGTTNNTTIPLEFMYDAKGTGSVDMTVMTMMPSGQVRLGNPNTLYQNFILGSAANSYNSVRLQVNGVVTAKGFIATEQNWSDFVFYAPAGNPTLAQEEKSIQDNCTLVGVPTEAEASLGRNLADNDALLLQKIEQLYLHVIDLNKQVEQLSTENKALKALLKP